MQLDKSKDNIKKTWRILNNVINRNKRKESILKLHIKDISNPEKIANKFCQYFTKIGAKLAQTWRAKYHRPQNLLENS